MRIFTYSYTVRTSTDTTQQPPSAYTPSAHSRCGGRLRGPGVVHRLLADGQVLRNVIPESALPEGRNMLSIGVEQLDRRL